jgi:DNA modification methylase
MTRKRANSLDGKTWTRHSISVWSDIAKTLEERRLKHPAMFPGALAERVIECFVAPEDRVVLDPFAGVGSTLLAARRKGLVGVGVEISPEFAALARRRLAQEGPSAVDGDWIIHEADARRLLDHVAPESVDLAVTSPPYWSVLGQRRSADHRPIHDYGGHAGDLSEIADYEEFVAALAEVFAEVLKVLKPGKFLVAVVMDLRRRDRFYPFHSDLAEALQGVGYTFEDLIIWDRRQDYNSLRPLGYPSVFRINKVHEYLLIFRKPPKAE